jgi:methylated-DNA-[protein]-cysteine S-methyltransferase
MTILSRVARASRTLESAWPPRADGVYGREASAGKPMGYVHATMTSPLGELTLVGSDKGLAAVLWENDDPARVPLGPTDEDRNHPLLVMAGRQFDEYFAGGRRTFAIDLDLRGAPFQRRVWEALLAIPFGETRSYGELARQIGRPKATRAVGAANGRNPVSIIVPCHRVIGASGRLTGFAGGLEAKAHLLRLEGVSSASLAPVVRSRSAGAAGADRPRLPGI